MALVTVWTKQHKNILQTLEETGRHIAKREYIVGKMDDVSTLYLDVYTWFTSKAAEIVPKPDDVRYPVWVSLASRLLNDEHTVVLELEMDDSLIIPVDYEKWGHMLNYMYLPASKEDMEEHNRLLADYRVDDTQAYMSSFYPVIKKKIIKSWDRLFDFETNDPDTPKMGTIWEIRNEWIKQVIM